MCHTSKCSWIIHKKWELLCILSWTCISAVVYQPQEILKDMLMHTCFLIYLCTSIIWGLCVYLYIFFTWKKCVKCFIPVGTHSRFTESVQAMQKLHFFCNYSLSTWRCILVKKKKDSESFILSRELQSLDRMLGALWTSLPKQQRVEQLTDYTMEESSRLYDWQLRVSVSSVATKLLLLHI